MTEIAKLSGAPIVTSSHDVNFDVTLNGASFECTITLEALDELTGRHSPSRGYAQAMFDDDLNRPYILAVATELIRKGRSNEDGRFRIYRKHVRPD